MPPSYTVSIVLIVAIAAAITITVITIAVYRFNVHESNRYAANSAREDKQAELAAAQAHEQQMKQLDIAALKAQADRSRIMADLIAAHKLYCPSCGKKMELRKQLADKEKSNETVNTDID